MDIKTLNRSRGGIKAQITKLSKISDVELKKFDHFELKNKIQVLNRYQERLDVLKLEYYKIVSDEQVIEVEEAFEIIDEDIQKLKVSFDKALDLLKVKNVENVAFENKSEIKQKVNIKLPEISLPKFEGNYENWNNFKSQFNSIVASNELLTDSQKLFYLQASLIGNASLIQSTDDTFESLFKALTDRFENKRLIVNSHISHLLKLESVQFESAEKLRILVDNSIKHVRALKVMKIEMDSFGENLLINVILNKLDKTTRKEYEMTLVSSELSSWDTFISFLKDRCQVLENLQKSNCNNMKTKHFMNQMKVKNFVVNNITCQICGNSSHQLFRCESFLNLTPLKRFDIVKRYKLCNRCLSSSHYLSQCKCKYACRYCHSFKHNYLLCRDFNPNCERKTPPTTESGVGEIEIKNADSMKQTGDQVNESLPQVYASCLASEKRNVLLATASVFVKSADGSLVRARAILDSGSQISAITEKLANTLRLNQRKVNILVSSLSGKSVSIRRETTAIISNSDGSFTAPLNLLILKKVTDFMPSTEVDVSQFRFPKGIALADVDFHKPSQVDLLIGAELFFSLLKKNTIDLSDSLIMKETVFGYIISGRAPVYNKAPFCGFISQLTELEQNVKKFWELENLEDSPTLKEEELECENIFCKTYCRNEITGKYTVDLPLRENFKLGNSRCVAESRLDNLWRKLDKNEEMKTMYTNFMKEYEQLGHMMEVEFSIDSNCYIMPHHGVFREDSVTTKLRVVFDASAPSSNGISLNNCLLKGGVVQEDLFSILLRFRKHKIALVADIEKMYRQVWVNPEQRYLQCILWKESSEEEAKLFQLKTVTYGTASAPFLATRVLKQLALDEKNRFPLASDVALSDFYVDDILTGADEVPTALELQGQLIEMLKSGGMNLHKWCSNEKALLDRVSLDQNDYDFIEGSTVKTLGLRWSPNEDSFCFEVACGSDLPTKRSVLSEISRLFDPLGLLSPVVTLAKMFLQRLWQMKIEWNQELPLDEKEKWINFRSNLLKLKEIRIPRYIQIGPVDVIEIHGFSDAAKGAYGAAIYLRCRSKEGAIKVSLLCSKSRVAPLKEITIPRLELCGAVLLANLVKKVVGALKIHIDQVFLYTDSEIVLAWIAKSLPELKLFVKNRVKTIQELTDHKSWRHVNSKDNPADVLSRGIDASKIENCKLWWYGPSFLHEDAEVKCSKSEPVEDAELYLRELKDVPNEFCAFVKDRERLEIIDKCSSFCKLQRVIAWCLRFTQNARLPKTVGCLSANELSRALLCIVKNVQSAAFPEEIQRLKKGKALSCNSNLLNLCPFLDSSGVLRVGGRLRNSSFGLNQKHPMLLPNNHNFTYLVINHYHVLYLHIGAEGTLSFIRCRFWILRGRNIVRKVIQNCLTCKKVSAKGAQQLMADLPSSRISSSKRVFNTTGLDFAGPFCIKAFPGRTKNLYKCFVCIFICFAVKAVHFEIVGGLSSEAFLAALKRFVARRGKPSEIFSDNGSGFVGANNELHKIIRELFKGNKKQIEDYVATEGIKWNFNPPSAPHFGGLWEAGVKSLKYHLKRVIGNTVLTHEEFLTLVTQIEAVLNSRPLCALSNDPNDFSVLTPAHFLVGSSLVALPDPDYIETPTNRLSRWQLVQKFTQTLWKRWANEYINRLQQRPKWSTGFVKFKKGDIVLVRNAGNEGYLKWHIARIVNTHEGKDNIVRVVTIKTKTGTYKRPVTKIAALPFVNEGN